MPFIVSRASLFLLITFFTALGSMATAFHKYYLSTTTIEINDKSQTLECTLMFFRDDFERVLEGITRERVYLMEHSEDSTLAPLVKEYILDKFSIAQENEGLQLSYIGYESDEEHVWVYVESQIPMPGGFSVVNSCLMELFEDQKNVINFKQGEDVKSELLLGQRRKANFEMK